MDLYYSIHFLTVEDYACICDSQHVHGHTRVVSIVLFRHVEKNQHGLFTFVFDFDSIESVEKAAMNKVGLIVQSLRLTNDALNRKKELPKVWNWYSISN